MSSIKESLLSLTQAYDKIDKNPTKVLNSRFNAAKKNNGFGNTIRRIFLGLPGIKLIASKFLGVTSSCYVASKVSHFCKIHQNQLERKDWVLLSHAFAILQKAAPGNAKVQTQQDFFYNLAKNSLLDEAKALLAPKVNGASIDAYFQNLTPEAKQTLLMNLSEQKIAEVAHQINPHSNPPPPPQSKTPSPSQTTPTPPPVDHIQSLIAPDLPQNIYCLRFRLGNLNFIPELLKSKFPQIEVIDLDDGLSLDDLKLNIKHPCQILVFTHMNARLDIEVYEKLCQKLKEEHGEHVIFSVLRNSSQPNSEIFWEPLDKFPIKTRVVGTYDFILDPTGMSPENNIERATNPQKFLNDLVIAFNKRVS